MPLTELDALLSRVREMRYNYAYADRNAVAYDCYRMFDELATRYKEECASRDRYDAKLAESQAERDLLAEALKANKRTFIGYARRFGLDTSSEIIATDAALSTPPIARRLAAMQELREAILLLTSGKVGEPITHQQMLDAMAQFGITADEASRAMLLQRLSAAAEKVWPK